MVDKALRVALIVLFWIVGTGYLLSGMFVCGAANYVFMSVIFFHEPIKRRLGMVIFWTVVS